MSEWRPRSEAPEDGSYFLFYSPGNPKAEVHGARREYWNRDRIICGRGWKEYPEAPYTHFMPLSRPSTQPTGSKTDD